MIFPPHGKITKTKGAVTNEKTRTGPYTATVSYERNNGAFEFEPNNTLATATRINLNTPVMGNMLSVDDVDYYRFTVNTAISVSVEFRHDYIDYGSQYWGVQLLQADGGKITELRNIGNVLRTETDKFLLQPGEYFVRVARNAYSYVDYTVTVRT